MTALPTVESSQRAWMPSWVLMLLAGCVSYVTWQFSRHVMMFLFLKIRSGTCLFMTTNTSATFLGIAKGEVHTGPLVFFIESGLVWELPCSYFYLFLFFTRVTSLSMSPVDDTFISGSLDKTIRLWDLRSPNCQVSSFLF